MFNYKNFLNKNSISIFLFHGITKKKLDFKIRNYNKKHIDENYFYKICQGFKNVGHSMSMDQIHETISKKKKKLFHILLELHLMMDFLIITL